ncbi:hypothetical protein TWF281_010931 [Arthrobotrys megalospora]
MSRSPVARAQRINPTTWEPLKQRIIELWLLDNPLQYVIKKIQSETGFVASEAQYRRQLHEVWGIRKYFSSTGLAQISDQINQRAAQGKETRVTRNGVEIPIQNLRRRRTRRFVSTMDAIVAKMDKEADSIGKNKGQSFDQTSLDANIVNMATPPTIATPPTPPNEALQTPGEEIARSTATNPPTPDAEISNVPDGECNTIRSREQEIGAQKVPTVPRTFTFQVGYKDVLRVLSDLRTWCPGFPFHEYEIFIQSCCALFLDGYYEMVFSSDPDLFSPIYSADLDKLNCQIKAIVVLETQFRLIDFRVFNKSPYNKIVYSLDPRSSSGETFIRIELPLHISYSDFHQFQEGWRPPLPIAEAYDTVYPIIPKIVVVKWSSPYRPQFQSEDLRPYEMHRDSFPRPIPERIYSSNTLSELIRHQVLPHGDETGSGLRIILDTFFLRIGYISNATWMIAIRLAIRHDLLDVATKFIQELRRHRGGFLALDYRVVLEATYWLASRSESQPHGYISPRPSRLHDDELFNLIYRLTGKLGPDEAESLLLVSLLFRFERGIEVFSHCVGKGVLDRLSKLVQ